MPTKIQTFIERQRLLRKALNEVRRDMPVPIMDCLDELAAMPLGLTDAQKIHYMTESIKKSLIRIKRKDA